MKKLIFVGAVCATVFGLELNLDEVRGDEFIINGAHYLTLKPCDGWEKGDKIVVIKGEKDARCLTAVMLNSRTKTQCELLCDAK